MARRTLIRGGIVLDAEVAPHRRDRAVLDEDVGVLEVAEPWIEGDDAIEARDDILRRAEGANGARLGGDWIPEPYEAAETA